MGRIPTYTVSVPAYRVHEKPDAFRIGRAIDAVFKRHFLGQRVVIRMLGSAEHKGKTARDIIRIIKRTGTDRYDPRRKGDRYDNIGKKPIDFFALECRVHEGARIAERFVAPFYIWPKKFRGAPIRLDIAIVYDRARVRRVVHTYDGKRIKRDGFAFRDPKRKRDAVLGVVHIR